MTLHTQQGLFLFPVQHHESPLNLRGFGGRGRGAGERVKVSEGGS